MQVHINIDGERDSVCKISVDPDLQLSEILHKIGIKRGKHLPKDLYLFKAYQKGKVAEKVN